MSKLNQEYFKSRKEHEEKVSSKSWLLLIPILIIFLAVMAWATNKTNEIGVNRVKEVEQNITKGILESNTTEDQKIVDLENLGLTVELHKGLKYNYSKEVNMLTAISQDSTELAYLIGEVPLNMQKSNMKELWIKGVKEKDPNQIFRDSLEQTIIETNQNGKKYKGILKFKEFDNKSIVLNSVSLKRDFNELETKMNKVFESLKAK
jgi:hypothetical protein